MVLDLHEKVLGPEHPQTLISIANLARTYSGKCQEAETLHLKVLDLFKKVLGLEHPRTLTRISNLATIDMIQGKQKS